MARKWTDEEHSFMREFVPGHSIHEIIDEFERRFGYRLTEPQVKNKKQSLGVKSGTTTGRFVKGDPRSGFKSEEHKRKFMEAGKATRFKNGGMPHNGHQPIGTERVDKKDGYVWVKVAERKSRKNSAHDNWVQKHRLVWERHNGKIPEGHMVVFIDGDRTNCDIGNLAIMKSSEHAVIARHLVHEFSCREELDAKLATARIMSKRYALEKELKGIG